MKAIIAIVLVIVASLTAHFYIQATALPEVSDVEFTLIDGQRISLRQLRGRSVLVTFWATSCAACIREIPGLISLYKRHSPKDLEIIAVAMPYDRPDHIIAMSKQRQLPYPVALDIDARTVSAFGNVRITPNNFLIGPDGRIIKQQIGILDVAATERLLQAM